MKRKRARVYMHTAERMREVKAGSVKLLVGGSVHLDGDPSDWTPYQDLYHQVYSVEGSRILRGDGVLLVVQTNAYHEGRFVCRYAHMVALMELCRFRLIDERVWQRRKADHFQVPFSHVLAFAPPHGTATRKQLNDGDKAWFRGVWDYPATARGGLNAWPVPMCEMVVRATTQPGDVIVDAFAGTGTLLGVAHREGRVGIGYEIDDARVPDIQANDVDVFDASGVLMDRVAPSTPGKARKRGGFFTD